RGLRGLPSSATLWHLRQPCSSKTVRPRRTSAGSGGMAGRGTTGAGSAVVGAVWSTGRAFCRSANNAASATIATPIPSAYGRATRSLMNGPWRLGHLEELGVNAPEGHASLEECALGHVRQESRPAHEALRPVGQLGQGL